MRVLVGHKKKKVEQTIVLNGQDSGEGNHEILFGPSRLILRYDNPNTHRTRFHG